MKTAYAPITITLSFKNSKGIIKLAALIGCTPDQLANQLLAETIDNFADARSGALEGFLGATYYPDEESGPTRIGPRDADDPSEFQRMRLYRARRRRPSKDATTLNSRPLP